MDFVREPRIYTYTLAILRNNWFRLALLSGPVLRESPRDYLSDTPYCALWGFWCLNMANWVRYPLPLLSAFPPWRACEVEVRYPPPPTQKGYLSNTCAMPHENKANGCDTPLCGTISKRYCAIWGVSRTGPLSCCTHKSSLKKAQIVN